MSQTALPTPEIRSEDTAPWAVTLNVGSSLANETGSWRTERPVYVSMLPPVIRLVPPVKMSRHGCTTPRRAITRPLGAKSW